ICIPQRSHFDHIDGYELIIGCRGELAEDMTANVITLRTVIANLLVQAFFITQGYGAAIHTKCFPHTRELPAGEALREPTVEPRGIAEDQPQDLRLGIVEHAVGGSPDWLGDH